MSTAPTNNQTGDDLLACENLTAGYGRRTVVGPLTLTVTSGPLTVMGPNGAGKSTLMRLITTAHRPAAGGIRVLGMDTRSRTGIRALRRVLGYAPQDFRGVANFTVVDTVAYSAWLKGVPRGRVRDACREAIESVDLGEHSEKKVSQLSGGMLRRLAIAQAMVNQPDLLVLDEPTAGLDPMHAAEVRAVMARVARRTSVLLVSHLAADPVAIDGRLIILRDGRVVHEGPVPRAAGDAESQSAIEQLYRDRMASGI